VDVDHVDPSSLPRRFTSEEVGFEGSFGRRASIVRQQMWQGFMYETSALLSIPLAG
jgi:hypothetical protein